MLGRKPLEVGVGFGQAIERLFEERFQPVYLLFDQFEELLIQGGVRKRGATCATRKRARRSRRKAQHGGHTERGRVGHLRAS
ncbi:MAG: hypothetical protein ACKOA4_12140 [Haliscomenobacter sp.]